MLGVLHERGEPWEPRPQLVGDVPALIKALARAHAALDRLCSGTARMAARELTTTINLACLAPDITRAILDGTQPQGLTSTGFAGPSPLAWTEQRRRLGFPAAAGRNDDAVSHELERRRRVGRATGQTETTTELSPRPGAEAR